MLGISALTNSLTWKEPALTRSFPMIIPLLAIICYGLVASYDIIVKRYSFKTALSVLMAVLALFCFFRISSLYIYFANYPKRALVVREWQCGYKEATDYLKDNARGKKVYFSMRHGQPYIYILYYMKYDPHAFQKSAVYSANDKNGFSSVTKFGNYSFGLPEKLDDPHAVYVGYPEEFIARGITEDKVQKKIDIRTEHIFWIYSPEK
ncbi:MAG: hypothetical protein ACMG6E_00815 [Candidatus Roizmanbacteria bacterium]